MTRKFVRRKHRLMITTRSTLLILQNVHNIGLLVSGPKKKLRSAPPTLKNLLICNGTEWRRNSKSHESAVDPVYSK